MNPRILITPELAVAVGELARKHLDDVVEIAYYDDQPEQLWTVSFESPAGAAQTVYLVNDETGEATLVA